MTTVDFVFTTRELRAGLSEALGRTMYRGERIGVTRNGRLAAVLISPEDLELLEELEMARDVAAYRAARNADDGTRISLDELRASLGQ